MRYTFLTLFPNLIDPYFTDSILARAEEQKCIAHRSINIRDFADNKHNKVDDHPYGGGAGMLIQAEPVIKAIKSVRSERKARVILLDARGKRFTQSDAKRLSEYEELIFVCGRYEGVDERVVPFVDEQISVGDFVMTGGELGALMIADVVSRLVPGVLGNEESLREESHTAANVEYPQYTRPEKLSIDGVEMAVPEILLSGDHKKIEQWRRSQ